MAQENSLQFDILIVGGGPAGLASAIRLAQLNQKEKKSLTVCVLEKGAKIGAHIISGCVLNPRSLNKLIPNWRDLSTPITTGVKKDKFYYLTQGKAIRCPVPPQMINRGNYMISLSQLCTWLGQYAEQLGITVIPGYAAKDYIYDDNKKEITGVITGEMGRKKDHSKNNQYQPGVKIYAKKTILAEGCKGSITEQIIEKFHLRKNTQMQNYAIGVKEVWTPNSKNYQDGLCIHTIGWPLDSKTYGGGFIYHYQEKIAVGIVIGLDYKNPTIDPHSELQRFKTHPLISSSLTDGKCIAYGARALNEGGYQAIPQLEFPGGVIVGCGAGLLNIAQLKGTHNAIDSGITAAESLFSQLTTDKPINNALSGYQEKLFKSIGIKELKQVRNIRPGFYKGRFIGLINAAFETLVRGLTPWTLTLKDDVKSLQPITSQKKITYTKPDGVLTFSKTDSVRLTATNHEEDQPCHLIIKNPDIVIPINYEKFGGPEQYYCPANVYEYVELKGKTALQINAQNCIHCKTCAIKGQANTENIVWIPPQGGEGPKYSET